MDNGRRLLLLFGSRTRCLYSGQGQVNVIPLPNDMEIKEGFFEIDSTRFVNEGADKFITCHIDSASYNELGDEGYELSYLRGCSFECGYREEGLLW